MKLRYTIVVDVAVNDLRAYGAETLEEAALEQQKWMAENGVYPEDVLSAGKVVTFAVAPALNPQVKEDDCPSFEAEARKLLGERRAELDAEFYELKVKLVQSQLQCAYSVGFKAGFDQGLSKGYPKQHQLHSNFEELQKRCDDLELVAEGTILHCPHCERRTVIAGYTCSACGKDPHGEAWE